MIDSLPCVDPVLERQYVAAAYLDPEMLGGTRLDPENISSYFLREVLRACYAVEKKAGTWTPLTVAAQLQDSGLLVKAGGKEFLNCLTVEHIIDPQVVARRLEELALARRKLDLTRKATYALEKGELDESDAQITKLLETTYGVAREIQLQTAPEVLEYGYDTLANIVGGKSKQVLFGLDLLDNYIGGITPGSMTVIGGRTGAGKSSLALLIALQMARAGHRPGIVSCEDPPDVWAARLAAHLSGAPSSMIYRRAMKDAELCSKFANAVEVGHNLPIEFAFTTGAPTSANVEAIYRLVRERKCDVIFVDYIQAIRFDLRLSRHISISDAASQIKGMCARLGVPEILVSQLSRPKENPFKEPQLWDLKESGDLENTAEVVLLLWKKSGEYSAKTYAKLAKVKWAPEGMRAELTRNPQNGMIDGIVEEKEYDE